MHAFLLILHFPRPRPAQHRELALASAILFLIV
jgi:hypothetical protein